MGSHALPGGSASLSSAFTDGGRLPLTFTCYNNGGNAQSPPDNTLSPPFQWANAPKDTVSFALLANGPDNHPAKGIAMEMFWALWNIPATAKAMDGHIIGSSIYVGTLER
jgi:phosphatidylethanolamine-binding protein (PEBP) family uncharacterized protein